MSIRRTPIITLLVIVSERAFPSFVGSVSFIKFDYSPSSVSVPIYVLFMTLFSEEVLFSFLSVD